MTVWGKEGKREELEGGDSMGAVWGKEGQQKVGRKLLTWHPVNLTRCQGLICSALLLLFLP